MFKEELMLEEWHQQDGTVGVSCRHPCPQDVSSGYHWWRQYLCGSPGIQQRCSFTVGEKKIWEHTHWGQSMNTCPLPMAPPLKVAEFNAKRHPLGLSFLPGKNERAVSQHRASQSRWMALKRLTFSNPPRTRGGQHSWGVERGWEHKN